VLVIGVARNKTLESLHIIQPHCKQTTVHQLSLVSTILLPFRHCRFAILLCSAIVPLLFFRSVATVAIAGENGIAGNVFPYTYRDEVTRTLIGCPPTVDRQK